MNPTISVAADRTTLRLSDVVTVTVTATGPAPLVVQPPVGLLSPESADAWKVEVAHQAVLRERGDGTAEWVQQYRLSPYLPGEGLSVTFEPFRINGTVATPQPINLTVETSLKSATVADARPVTDIETLPALSTGGVQPLVWVFASLVGVMVVNIVVLILFRRRRKAPVLTPDAWALQQLAGCATAAAVADVLRGYLERRFGIRAERQTTAEVLASGDAQGVWTADGRDAVQSILEAGDREKFARDDVAADASREALQTWIASLGEAGA